MNKCPILTSLNIMVKKYESLQSNHSDVLSKYIGVADETGSAKFIF